MDPGEFDVAISYLVRRLEENAAPENFMSGVFNIATSEDVFARERDRFLAALSDVDPDAAVPFKHDRDSVYLRHSNGRKSLETSPDDVHALSISLQIQRRRGSLRKSETPPLPLRARQVAF